jgi:serine/threonine protein kinase
MQHGTILKHLAENGNINVQWRVCFYFFSLGSPFLLALISSSSFSYQLFEIAQGLAYLHSQDIIHGDLRGTNILVDNKGHACLADFGLAVFSNATLANQSSQHGGSVRWMGPELLYPQSCGLEYFQRTFANDVYSFACVCIEVCPSRDKVELRI